DRAAQTLVRFALEPEWEARFEPNSFGFRPGRSCHDAIQAVFNGIRFRAKYVLDADIAACFDRINHQTLLDKLHTFPTLRRVIRGWLKAGVVDGKELFPTDEGTPQGGAISPLLANVALHGLETHLRASFPGSHRGDRYWKPIVVRCADDFVVLHQDLAVIEQTRQIANMWLAGMGLELKPGKTRIAHTLVEHEGRVGFDFLGCTVRQFPAGHYRSARSTRGAVLGFKTHIKPSAEAQKRHLETIADVVRRYRQSLQEVLVEQLNPKIVGWARYYATGVAKDVFSRMDHLVYLKLKRWAERRHPHTSKWWVAGRYWHTRRGRMWNFGPKKGPVLAWYADTPIQRHVKVKGTASPFDGNWAYWASRMGHHPELPTRVATLLRRQQGRCARCGLYFARDDLPEVDHITPKHLGGSDAYSNWQLLHRHCHDSKTAEDRASAARLSV
ncbi:MAG: group II intron reverse transcriptase, partial [Chloroflexota bacterium]